MSQVSSLSCNKIEIAAMDWRYSYIELLEIFWRSRFLFLAVSGLTPPRKAPVHSKNSSERLEEYGFEIAALKSMTLVGT